MKTMRLAIDGMSCGHCVQHVTKTLASIEGTKVQDVAVGSAGVGFDPEKTTQQAILHALVEAGYPARVADAGGEDGGDSVNRGCCAR